MNKTDTLNFEMRDEFGRKEIADTIISLLQSDFIDETILLDGAWGAGKTEFCKKTIEVIKNTKLLPVYVDCYKYDHICDPLMMLVTQLYSEVKDKKLKEKLRIKSIPLLKVVFKGALKLFTTVALKESSDSIAKDLQEVVKEVSGDLIGEGVDVVFKGLEEYERNLELFRNVLRDITKDNQIVFFIDELDRCRPTFALNVLEIVKHVFGEKSAKFVFSTNIAQLEATVKAQYGESIDAGKYLGKFFPLQFTLPQEFLVGFNESTYCSFEHFRALSSRDALFANDLLSPGSVNSIVIERIFRINRLSLRDAEKMHLAYKVHLAMNPGNKSVFWIDFQILIYALSIHCFDRKLKEKILEDELGSVDLSQSLQIERVSKSDGHYDRMHARLFVCILLGMKETEINEYLTDEGILKEYKANLNSIYSKGFREYEAEKPLLFFKTVLREMAFLKV